LLLNILKSISMKLTLLFISLLFISLSAKNNDYSTIIDKEFNNKLLDIRQDYDRDISAVGFVRKYITKQNKNNGIYSSAFEYLDTVGNAHGTQMQLVKLNSKSGKVVLDKSSKLSNFSEAIALTKTPSNGYYIGGHTMDGQLILLKLDAQANLIFKKNFGTKNFDRLNNIVQLSDG